MVKLAQSTIKYLIEAEFIADGTVEKPDVIGAVFGQTEGLLGSDLDLRELQKTGRIGRIEVEISYENGKTKGKIVVPSSLDSTETALIAASLETIEKIGPCNSQVFVKNVKDVREVKRQFIVNRAKSILKDMIEEDIIPTSLLKEKIREEARITQIKQYNGLPCGPDIFNSDEIIVVEGRADVINLLKNGIKNVIALDGAKIPQQIIDLSKERITTLFIDGDRGGDLIAKEFLQLAEVDYIAKAPQGKEVEELTKKEIFKSLRERTPIEQYRLQPKAKELKEFISTSINSEKSQ